MSGTTNTVHSARAGFWETGFDWSQFLTLLEAMPDAAVAVDPTGQIVATNSEVERMLGYPAGTLIGKSVEVLVPRESVARHRLFRERFAAQPHSRPMGVGRNCRDEKPLDVDISLSPLRVDSQQVIVVAMRDVTERRDAERQIRALNEQLEERVGRRTAELQTLNRSLEEFSYAVSHELRSPLRIVRGFAELLRHELAMEQYGQANECLEHICEASNRMSRIVEGLLALAHLEHHTLRPMPVDMTETARRVVADLREESPGLQVTIEVGELPPVQGDEVLLRQVLANLMANAVKYCGNRPAVVISVRGWRIGGNGIYQVRDNGPGFDSTQAAVVFDPFKRLQNSDPVEGLGIGLALARRIVERHRGRIWAESSAGGGATFSFSLPLAGSDAG